MNHATQTPEHTPGRCSICGGEAPVEPLGDVTCATCGQLMWWCREHLSELLGVSADAITPGTTLHDLGADSLDIVELVMELEEEFDVQIADEEAVKRMRTVGDAVRYIESLSGGRLPARR